MFGRTRTQRLGFQKVILALVAVTFLPNAPLRAGQEVAQGGSVGGADEEVRAKDTSDHDRPPKPIKITRPQYPRAAFDDKIEGTVVVEILIDEKGRVHPRRILTSIPALDAAAVETVREWTFNPAIKNGLAVATIAHAPIGFRIFPDKKKDRSAKHPSPTPAVAPGP